jgi:hypothetical protein
MNSRFAISPILVTVLWSYGNINVDATFSYDASPPTAQSWEIGEAYAKNMYCDKERAEICWANFETCLSEGLANSLPRLCDCAETLFYVCLRPAGCTISYLKTCYEMQVVNQCSDMRICCVDCVSPVERTREDILATIVPSVAFDMKGSADDGADISLTTFWDSHVTLTINNRGLNPLRVRYCILDISGERLERHSQVVVNRCEKDALMSCPYFFPGRATTVAVIPLSATYIIADLCASVEIDGVVKSKCIEALKPIEVHGFQGEWKKAIHIEYPGQRYCISSAYSPDRANDPGCGPDARCLNGFSRTPAFCGYTSVRWLLSGDKFAKDADDKSCAEGMVVSIAVGENGKGSIHSFAQRFNVPLQTVIDALPAPRIQYDQLEVGDTFCLFFTKQTVGDTINANRYVGSDWEALQLQKVGSFQPWWLRANWESLFHIKNTRLLTHGEFDTTKPGIFQEPTKAPDTWSWNEDSMKQKYSTKQK